MTARRLLLAPLASIALATPAAAHPGGPAGGAAATDPVASLHGCLLTVAYAPRPAAALQDAIPGLPDLTRTFYGNDPLLGVWALSCQGPVTMSLVAVPVGVTSDGAPPLANFLAHALLRVDTDSPKLAQVLRKGGLPVRVAPHSDYVHSPAGVVPSTGRLSVKHGYGVAVSATALDPTNPHDHRNAFTYGGSRLSLATDGAHDRFCFAGGGGCSATLSAPAGSEVARILGGTSAQARIGFDHARIGRIDLGVGGP